MVERQGLSWARVVVTLVNGKAVKVRNLPSPTFQDYTRYKSVDHRHRGGDKEFQYSGTTGFTSKLDVGGKKE